jgi:hypothetical protein
MITQRYTIQVPPPRWTAQSLPSNGMLNNSQVHMENRSEGSHSQASTAEAYNNMMNGATGNGETVNEAAHKVDGFWQVAPRHPPIDDL